VSSHEVIISSPPLVFCCFLVFPQTHICPNLRLEKAPPLPEPWIGAHTIRPSSRRRPPPRTRTTEPLT
jgi:hypothetical protein